MSETGRSLTTTQKVETEFGSMYVHVEVDAAGRPAGGSISTPGKEPGSQIARLVAALSEGLGAATAATGLAGPPAGARPAGQAGAQRDQSRSPKDTGQTND